jgi:hypothetical protein
MSAQPNHVPRRRPPRLPDTVTDPTVRRLCWGCAKSFPVAKMTQAMYRGSRCWECATCAGSTTDEDDDA